MTLESLFLVVGTFAVILATQVQLCKAHIPQLKGLWVIAFSLVLGAAEGALFGYLGVQGMSSFTTIAPAASGAVIGVLAGISASGGKDLATGVGINFAKAQAKAQKGEGKDCEPKPPASTETPPAEVWEEVGLEALVQD